MIVHRRPKPHKKLYPCLMKLHREIGRSEVREIGMLSERMEDKSKLTLPGLAGIMRRMDQLRAKYNLG